MQAVAVNCLYFFLLFLSADIDIIWNNKVLSIYTKRHLWLKFNQFFGDFGNLSYDAYESYTSMRFEVERR